MPLPRGFPFAKTVTILASIFGIALGMCGLNYVIVAGINGVGGDSAVTRTLEPVMMMLGILELVAMAVTGPLLVLTVIAWVIAEAVGIKAKPGTQTLFGHEDDKGDS